MITVSADRLAALEKRSAWLDCLEGAGVDNWEGYQDARDFWEEAYKEEYGEL